MATTKPRKAPAVKAAKGKAKAAPKKPAPPVAPSPWEQFKAAPDSIDVLCSHVLEGGHLNEFCIGRGFAYTSMLRWINADPAGRAAMYAQAREDRSDKLADEITAISDEIDVKTTTGPDGEVRLTLDAAAVARNRLRVDARKWVASKLKPRVYGEKLELGGSVKVSGVADDALLAELAKMGIAAKIGPQPEPEAPDA